MDKKKKRNLILLAVVFLILLAGYLGYGYYEKNHQEEEETVTEKVLEIDSSKVTEIGITQGESSVNLKKEGAAWTSEDDNSITIDSDKVESFLADACDIPASLVIPDVTDFDQYGLVDSDNTISLQWDNELYVITIGDQNSSAGGFFYVRVNDEDTVYTIESSVRYALEKTTDDFAADENEDEEADGQSDTAENAGTESEDAADAPEETSETGTETE